MLEEARIINKEWDIGMKEILHMFQINEDNLKESKEMLRTKLNDRIRVLMIKEVELEAKKKQGSKGKN